MSTPIINTDARRVHAAAFAAAAAITTTATSKHSSHRRSQAPQTAIAIARTTAAMISKHRPHCAVLPALLPRSDHPKKVVPAHARIHRSTPLLPASALATRRRGAVSKHYRSLHRTARPNRASVVFISSAFAPICKKLAR
eukprot:5035803-Pleurochrysis_carterae.AAC.1